MRVVQSLITTPVPGQELDLPSLIRYCSSRLCHAWRAVMLARLALASFAATASSDVQRSPTVWRPFPPSLVLPSSVARHERDADLSDSPSAPIRSSGLLRFWGEDLIRGGDIFAEQFWGDIFAELPHLADVSLTSPGHCL